MKPDFIKKLDKIFTESDISASRFLNSDDLAPKQNDAETRVSEDAEPPVSETEVRNLISIAKKANYKNKLWNKWSERWIEGSDRSRDSAYRAWMLAKSEILTDKPAIEQAAWNAYNAAAKAINYAEQQKRR